MKRNKLIDEILRDWYVIDSLILNDHAKYVITEQQDYSEYISIKKALLNNLFEFYNKIEYTPSYDYSNVLNDRVLQECAVNASIDIKKVTSLMFKNPQFRGSLIKLINESAHGLSHVETLSDEMISNKFINMNLDNILLAKPILECTKYNKDDFEVSIYESAHHSLMQQLITISHSYISEGVLMGTAAVALVSWMGVKLTGSAIRSLQSSSDACHNRCGAMRISTWAKRMCILKCKIQTEQQMISSLRQSAGQTNNRVARNRFAKDVRKCQLRMAKYQRRLAEIKAKHPERDGVEPDIKTKLW